jgi:hypothetical protein
MERIRYRPVALLSIGRVAPVAPAWELMGHLMKIRRLNPQPLPSATGVRFRWARRLAWVLLFGGVTAFAPIGEDSFERWFTDATLRFDYYHSGTAGREHISLDEIRLEGSWPGSRTRLLDGTNLGKYLFEVIDVESGALLYSRGFASIYGEWETTGEAADGVWRTFHESQRFPEPRREVRLVLRKRMKDGAFEPIFSVDVDPASRFVDRAPIVPEGRVHTLFAHGPPSGKVDLLVVGDGYRRDEREKFRRDAERLTGALFDTEPFKSRRADFNVRILEVDSPESGISDPRRGAWRSSALGLSFNAFDTDRYVLTYANRRLREAAALAPYDTLMILFNSGKYGGGGIFNLWATCASDTGSSAYVFVHEFGHSFGGLADEYYTSEVAYENFTPPGVEPWEPNITALLDPPNLKWGDLVEESTPIPTPWNQGTFDEVSRAYGRKRAELVVSGANDASMEQVLADSARDVGALLEAETHRSRVGAFEGAGYQARGLYRPAVDCIMFSRGAKEFCPVCRRALERSIDLYALP